MELNMRKGLTEICLILLFIIVLFLIHRLEKVESAVHDLRFPKEQAGQLNYQDREALYEGGGGE